MPLAEHLQRLRKTLRWKPALFVLAVLGLLGTGILLNWTGGGPSPPLQREETVSGEKPLFWTCSMHPQIKQPGPGLCPICNMELVPVYPSKADSDLPPRQISLSEAARKLADISTSPVSRRFVAVEVRMTGKVDYDETRVHYITAWVPGRIDRMYVDFTGTVVHKGDPMVWLYSPEIFSAQEEFLQAIKTAADLRDSGVRAIAESSRKTVEAARNKLRRFGLTDKQIAEVERRGTPSDHVVIHSPAEGVVVKKYGTEGMYVSTGTRLYMVADLSRVWVKLDAYESDISWVRLGQEVEFETESFPGDKFKGRVSFIDPVLNRKTRTVKVRVNVPNSDARLKPGMFVRAVVKARPDAAGNLTGQGEPPLVIPASAPLITGTRAVVYVAVPGKEGVFEGREVLLGPRAGDYYIVKKGLREGEKVVTKGNFKIDSALQIMAKSCMMSPEEKPASAASSSPDGDSSGSDVPADGQGPATPPSSREIPVDFTEQTGKVFDAYEKIRAALYSDDLATTRSMAAESLEPLSGPGEPLDGKSTPPEWSALASRMRVTVKQISSARDISEARKAFSSLSSEMIKAAALFGAPPGTPLYRFHCPMALDNAGADWLSSSKKVENPYFGTAMPGCGEIKETFNAPRTGKERQTR